MAKTAELVPENVWSERLEIVRKKSGLTTFALFVDRVRRQVAGDLPIPTARTWHTKRQPSLDYLRGVVLEYGVSAHWLLVGEGEPFGPGTAEDDYRRKLVPRKLESDLLYVAGRSFTGDLQILARSLGAVLRRSDR